MPLAKRYLLLDAIPKAPKSDPDADSKLVVLTEDSKNGEMSEPSD